MAEAVDAAVDKATDRSRLPAARSGGLRARAAEIDRLCGDGKDRPRRGGRRATSAGPTSAPGTRCSTSRRSDADGNVLQGPAVTMDAHGCVVHSDGRLTAVVGVDDLVVVSTSDAVMVVPRARAQEVQRTRRQAQGRQARRGDRPQARAPALGLLRVDRHGRALPGQAHRGRRRAACCRCRSTATAPSTGSWCAAPPRSPSTRRSRTCTRTSRSIIPIGSVHRLANQGKIPLELIEVQTGSYLGEDDIERIEDVYKRT